MRFFGWLWTLLLLAWIFASADGTRDIEDRRLNERLTHRPVDAPDPSIVIVGVDDEVFRLNRYNRLEHARVIDNLTQAGARQIFLDLIFDEPRGPQFDIPLIEAIKRSRRVVVAGVYRIDEEDARMRPLRPQFFPELKELIKKGICRMGIINTSRERNKIDALMAVDDHTGDDYWEPAVRLSAAAALVAASNHLSISDVETTPASPWIGEILHIPPLHLEVQTRPQNEIESLLCPIRYHPAATGPKGRPGLPGRFKVIPYLKVADGDPATLADMKNKFVLIGENTTSTTDTYETPVGQIKGVEIHAQILDALIRRRIPALPRPASTFLHLSELLIAVLCLAMSGLLKRQPSLWRCAGLVGSVMVLWEGLVVLGDCHNSFLPQTLGELAIFATAMLAMFLRFWSTQKVLRTFIPAAIVDQLIRDEAIHQGAVQATVMVTDIRGYTTLSESRTPTQVLELLNDYHSETVAHYERFGGHVLNYQGDAQIILFGHPKKLKDPALQAILAAQAASSAVEILRKRWNLPLDQAFNVGAGICTGKVYIAELGGDYREYTVIGEIVRKCHKLQSQSQILGANIILDEETYAVCREKPTVEKRENVVIDGLPEPVTVYITDIVPT
ncbi:adenylate/guanylate cyclase domain-containing protein [bacterium]|nr:adenylate/guanylate cyclase domain-containing protein [bacterium]